MENIEMSEAERKEYEEFKATKAKKEAAERRKQNRNDYAKMVDDEVATSIPILRELSGNIKTIKGTVFENFTAILKMKAEVMGLTQEGQRSHTFTTSDGNYRLTLGVNTIDGYRDTVEDGIAKVKQYIESLAKDDNSRALVRAILRLLSRDNKGNIKASRVIALEKMAIDSGNEGFLEGVEIIKESYQPTTTKSYIRAEFKDEHGAWRQIPLGMTEAE